MSKAFGVVLFGLLLSSISSLAQGPCPTANSTATSTIPTRSGDLICLVPQVYGGGGLVGTMVDRFFLLRISSAMRLISPVPRYKVFHRSTRKLVLN